MACPLRMPYFLIILEYRALLLKERFFCVWLHTLLVCPILNPRDVNIFTDISPRWVIFSVEELASPCTSMPHVLCPTFECFHFSQSLKNSRKWVIILQMPHKFLELHGDNEKRILITRQMLLELSNPSPLLHTVPHKRWSQPVKWLHGSITATRPGLRSLLGKLIPHLPEHCSCVCLWLLLSFLRKSNCTLLPSDLKLLSTFRFFFFFVEKSDRTWRIHL